MTELSVEHTLGSDLSQAPEVACHAMLPRLLYFGDVPVENYMHGSALLYRLLEGYPKEKLEILEGNITSDPARRVDGVTYQQCKPGWARLLRTRFSRFLSPIATLSSPLRRSRVQTLVRDFRPEAVITVVWGYAWVAAAAYAERARLPLHLIVHDDSLSAEIWRPVERRLINYRLRYWYPKAASRLCISPYMAEEYRRRYKAAADVVYPSRAEDVPIFTQPPETLAGPCAPFTVAFAGTIYPDYGRALQRMATALQRVGGQLRVFGPAPEGSARSFLQGSNIELRGRLSPRQFIQECREEAHAMFIPMSYRDWARCNAEISFPSKLADSTAIGIPLIIDGPAYCSAVRWARESPGVAEVVTDETVDALAECIARLQDPAHRLRLAKAAIHRGAQYFAPHQALKIFYSRLLRGSRSQNDPIDGDCIISAVEVAND